MIANPQQANDHIQRGIALADLNKHGEAAAAFQQALRLQPTNAEAHYHLGNALVTLGKIDEALLSFRQAVQHKPAFPEALTNLGVNLARLKKLPEAVAALQQAIAARPDFARAHHNLGVALAEQGKLEEALASLKQAVRLKPDYAEAHFNLGNTLADLNKQQEAIVSYKEALRYKPDYVDALSNLGLTLTQQKRSGEAMILLQQAARLKPDHVDARNNLGLAYADQGRFAEAIVCYEQALQANPHYAEAHTNLGSAYKEMGRPEEALACYDHALRLQPDAASTHWNRSLAWLQMGDYERGWPEYEWRWRRKKAKVRPFKQPMWDGSSLHGKAILLHTEQGLGDTIHFIRYVPLVKAAGGRVIVECPSILLPLISTVGAADQWLAEGNPLPPFDCHAPLMSLPAIFKNTLTTIPTNVPYLTADPERLKQWSATLDKETGRQGDGGTRRQGDKETRRQGDKETAPVSLSPCFPVSLSGFRIGIAWQGNPHHKWDRFRSFPLRRVEPLADVPGVQLISLQKGPGSEQLQDRSCRFPVAVLLEETGGGPGSFADIAAIMTQLDLIITADTATAHLAGALGLQVWVALATMVDWRWMLQREDSPWYPTMRLYRQRQLGDWEPVFERMKTDVQRILAGK